jgi:hypothetical protein
MGTMVFLLLMVMGLLEYTGNVQRRLVGSMRSVKRLDCAQTGYEMARVFFGRNFNSWATYLADPYLYNPINAACMTSYNGPSGKGPATPVLANGNFNTTLLTQVPFLFADIDNDGKPDVYIYIRDNPDESPPAVATPWADNDQNVYVGGVCISQTLRPHRADGTLDPNLEYVEGLLQYNVAAGNYHSQKGCGSTNSGNCNN